MFKYLQVSNGKSPKCIILYAALYDGIIPISYMNRYNIKHDRQS